jgi:hypothetical protein
MLAPYLALAYMNALILGEMPLVLCIQIARYQALRPITSTYHDGDLGKRLLNGLTILFARVEHRGEIAAWDESDFVSVTIVIAGKQAPRLLVLFAAIVQCKPTYSPSHLAFWEASFKGRAARSDTIRAVIGTFVLADRPRWTYLNLIHAHQGYMSNKPTA